MKVSDAHLSARFLQAKFRDFQPKIGMVLGSGLGVIADSLQDRQVISYRELPGFPVPQVEGHLGQLNIGYLNGTPVVCLQGRVHSYEGDSYAPIKTYIRTLKLLGCDILVVTNASGSLNPETVPGDLLMINDHIHFQPGNPLVGPNDDVFGIRFPPLNDAYDPELRKQFHQSAKKLGISLKEGVYIGVLGPSYETAAEIRAFRMWGADAIGMSTTSEVIVARHCGLRVAAICSITNLATGLTSVSHNHQEVVKNAELASAQLTKLIDDFVGAYHA